MKTWDDKIKEVKTLFDPNENIDRRQWDGDRWMWEMKINPDNYKNAAGIYIPIGKRVVEATLTAMDEMRKLTDIVPRVSPVFGDNSIVVAWNLIEDGYFDLNIGHDREDSDDDSKDDEMPIRECYLIKAPKGKKEEAMLEELDEWDDTKYLDGEAGVSYLYEENWKGYLPDFAKQFINKYVNEEYIYKRIQ